MKRVVIFDSHPVQYKAPVYRELEKICPGKFRVFYATDCSVRGHRDEGFRRSLAWDVPLLEGYDHRILNLERGVPLSSFSSLSGSGVFRSLKLEAPRAILISQFLYAADLAALWAARRLSLPVAIRHETQDEAVRRSRWKDWLRLATYYLLYSQVSHAFYIGELNQRHLTRFGFRADQMTRSPYCVPNPFGIMSTAEKWRVRGVRRDGLAIDRSDFVVLFCGKLIPKKNPELVFDAVKQLPAHIRRRAKVLVMGSGELEGELRKKAAELLLPVTFLGFINQSALAENYLAADVLVLPSRRMGETWGLVVNEALHAGCGVVMTDAVGCYRDFGSWERVRVTSENNSGQASEALAQIASFERSFDWCAEEMERYTVRAAAEGIASGFAELRGSSE